MHNAWLYGAETGGHPGKWVLDKEEYLIGRHPPADLVIPQSRISRQHARIQRRELGYYLEDLGSRNSTFVNGKALAQEPVRLNDGDEIVFAGVVSFRFYDPEETSSGPRIGRLEGIWIDQKLKLVWVDSKLLDPPLSAAQYSLLDLLYQHANVIVSREEIIAAVWPDVDQSGVSGEAVDGLVKRLRGRIRQLSPDAEYIEVIRGHGLRLSHPQ